MGNSVVDDSVVGDEQPHLPVELVALREELLEAFVRLRPPAQPPHRWRRRIRPRA